MASETIYDLCLPILQDDSIEQEDKTDKLEDLIRCETDLKDKPLEDAVLDILWRFRNRSTGPSSTLSTTTPRATVTKRSSPAPWQASRSATPVASSPRSSAASPAPPPGLSNRPALFRMRSAQHSPFTSPRPSPRLAFASPSLAQSSLSANPFDFHQAPSSSDGPGDGSDVTDWVANDDTASNASSGYGGDWNYNADWFQPQVADMSPHDLLRSVLQGQKSDEEIEGILEANGYDLSAAILSSMGEQGYDQSQIGTSTPEQEKTYLVGKSMASGGSRPSTPAGQGKSTIPCRYWLSTGQCLRADCKFSHDLSHHICKYWLAGNCIAGDACAFSHDPSSLMASVSMNEQKSGTSPPVDFQSNFHVNDTNSFPSLQGKSTTSSLYSSNDSSNTSSVLSARAGLAPEFIPSRPQSRPSSRHDSPARSSNPRFSTDESDAFPTLGASAGARLPKKHHGKRGHGHAHHRGTNDKENPSSGSLADLVRMSPSPNPMYSPRGRGFIAKPRPSYHGDMRESNAAAQAIPPPERIPWLETGERANKDYLKARGEAIKRGAARNKFLQSAAQAWHRNDVRAAKALSLRGQSENDLMRESHRAAARALYNLHNPPSPAQSPDQEIYIDLHGLHPAEAVSYLDSALKTQRRRARLLPENEDAPGRGGRVLYCIVGSGHHSKGGRDKVGKAVKAWLGEVRCVWREFGVGDGGGAVGQAGFGGGVGAGGILGIDVTSGRYGNLGVGEEENEPVEKSPQLEHGKIRILKAEEVGAGA